MDLAALLPARQYRYYLERLGKAEAAVYRALLAGLLRCEKQIACRGCTARQIQSIYRFLKMDVPELFFVKAIRVRYPAAKPLRCTVIPEYRFTAAQARDTLLCMARSCEGLVAKHRHSSDFQKEKAIHDHIAATVRYRDADAPYSHEAPGALLFRIGVCEGIAKAFKYLADRLGLRCIVAFGAADGQAGEIAHAWNVVCVGGAFYHLDATFDATLSGSCIRYDYFNLSDADIRATHRWDDALPPCPRTFGVYEKMGCCFQRARELAAYIQSASRAQKTIVFKLPPRLRGDETVADAIQKLLCANLFPGLPGGGQVQLSYNLRQLVFQVDLL